MFVPIDTPMNEYWFEYVFVPIGVVGNPQYLEDHPNVREEHRRDQVK